jgi:ABC-2 type transport system ATP-binding protein
MPTCASCRGHETTCALVAQALVHKPQVIVLDSPPPAWTSNFDKRSQFIAKLNKQGSYGAVDHPLLEGPRPWPRTAMLKQGRGRGVGANVRTP